MSAFGAQSVPLGCEAIDGTRWPTVDWERLAGEFGAHSEVLARRFPPADYPDAQAWAEATRSHQAQLLRTQIEILRRLKYRPCGGFTLDRLVDGVPAISGAVFDHHRRSKPAQAAVAGACAATVVVAWPPLSLREGREELQTWVSVIHDGREPLDPARVTAELVTPGVTQHWTWEGRVEADSVTDLGGITWPAGPATTETTLSLSLTATGVTATNLYTTSETPM